MQPPAGNQAAQPGDRKTALPAFLPSSPRGSDQRVDEYGLRHRFGVGIAGLFRSRKSPPAGRRRSPGRGQADAPAAAMVSKRSAISAARSGVENAGTGAAGTRRRGRHFEDLADGHDFTFGGGAPAHAPADLPRFRPAIAAGQVPGADDGSDDDEQAEQHEVDAIALSEKLSPQEGRIPTRRRHRPRTRRLPEE